MATAAFIRGGSAFPTIPGMTTDYDPAYGGRPVVPSPGASAATAIGSNIANLGDLYRLGGGVSDYAQTQLLSNLEKAIPNYSELVAQSSRNIGSELAGQIPGDVVSQILQRAAERGIMTGAPGSPNSSAAYLKAIGLTSLDMTGLGERNLTGSVGRTPLAQPFDISRLFTSPEEQQQAEMAASLYASAPVPSAAARAARAAASAGLPSEGGNRTWSVGPAPTFGGGGAGQQSDWWNDPTSPWNTGYNNPLGGELGYTGEYGGILDSGEMPGVDYGGGGDIGSDYYA